MKARVCLLGNLFDGQKGVRTQAFSLYQKFRDEGHEVRGASFDLGFVKRLSSMGREALFSRFHSDIVLMDVYSKRGFEISRVLSRILSSVGMPFALVLRGGGLPDLLETRPEIVQRKLRRAGSVVCPSFFMKRAFEGITSNIDVIPNFIEINNYKLKDRQEFQPRLFWMRTFHELYNPELAVAVLAKLRRRWPGATLIMAGEHREDMNLVKKKAEDLGVLASIEFPGFLDLTSKLRCASQSDIFINTNAVDNTPVSLIEAWALGLPVVATNVGGIPDLVDDKINGLLTAPNNADEMCAAVSSILDNPDLGQKLMREGRKKAESFDWSQVYSQWCALFERLANFRVQK